MIASRVYPCFILSNTLSKMFFIRTHVSDPPCRCIIVIVICKEVRNVHNRRRSHECVAIVLGSGNAIFNVFRQNPTRACR